MASSSCNALGPDLIFAGVTGHFRALGSRLCGSGGWVRKFHVPDHFRSFPSVVAIQAGAGCSLRAWCRGGSETRPYMPGTRFGGCRPGTGDGGQGRVLAEVEAENFCAPLISAQIRHFGVAGPEQGNAWGAECAGCPWLTSRFALRH